MSEYRLAKRGQQRLDIPSGDSAEVVSDVRQIIGQGQMSRRVKEGSVRKAVYVSSQGGVTASHYKGGFYTGVMTRNPAGIPQLWLALRAYREVAQRECARAVGLGTYVARPAGLLAVSTSVEDLPAKFSEAQRRRPDDFTYISVENGDEGQDEGEGPRYQSNIKIHRPGATIPEVLDGLAVSAKRLQSDSLGPNPKDELARQVGWEDHGALTEIWAGALRQDTALGAAQYCLGAYGISGALGGV